MIAAFFLNFCIVIFLTVGAFLDNLPYSVLAGPLFCLLTLGLFLSSKKWSFAYIYLNATIVLLIVLSLVQTVVGFTILFKLGLSADILRDFIFRYSYAFKGVNFFYSYDSNYIGIWALIILISLPDLKHQSVWILKFISKSTLQIVFLMVLIFSFSKTAYLLLAFFCLMRFCKLYGFIFRSKLYTILLTSLTFMYITFPFYIYNVSSIDELGYELKRNTVFQGVEFISYSSPSELIFGTKQIVMHRFNTNLYKFGRTDNSVQGHTTMGVLPKQGLFAWILLLVLPMSFKRPSTSTNATSFAILSIGFLSLYCVSFAFPLMATIYLSTRSNVAP